ncbi:hypothetical protein ACP70R_011648 [Stipagrostis hirtigluma subsp. patula]
MEAPGKGDHSDDAAGVAAGGLAGDRLSALPDCILHEIMSLMKARQVVQTSVLSTRWRHLWRSVPCLDVDVGEFRTAAAKAAAAGRHEQWENFEDFTDNLLRRVNMATLDSFRLRALRREWERDIDFHVAAGWIRRAIKYCAPAPGVHRDGLSSVSSSSSWRLRSLRLSGVNLDDRFAEHLASGCHFLEDLELKTCHCELQRYTNVPIVIKAPAVASLLLAMRFYYFRGGVSLDEMPCIAKASIHLREYELVQNGDQFKILRSVSNVTNLELLGFKAVVLGKKSSTFPEFKNLRNLVLDNCDLSDDFQILGGFLHNSPNLEKLTLRHCKYSNDSKKKKGASKLKKTSSSDCHNLEDVQCQNLKLTEIIYGEDDISHLVELLLRIPGNLSKNYVKLTKVD